MRLLRPPAFCLTHLPPRRILTHTKMSTSARKPFASPSRPLHYVAASKASQIDAKLMSPPYSFTLDQLMELAGQSVSHAIYHTRPPPARVTVVCGPGNNGGDGLVAARHLRHFGYAVTVHYPKRAARPPFAALVQQLGVLDVPVRAGLPLAAADVVVDAVFGFGFRVAGGVREPFGGFLAAMNEAEGVLLAVDVPSGWEVDGGGKAEGAVRTPDVLVSLTAPKMCARGLQGVQHWVGGRFVPRRLCEELAFEVPEYPGIEGVVRVE